MELRRAACVGLLAGLLGPQAGRAADVGFCLTTSLGKEVEEPTSNLLSQFRVELPDGTALTPESEARVREEVYARPGQRIKAKQCLRGDVVLDVSRGVDARYFSATVSQFGWVRWQLS
jgi:hypothetical protein